MIKDVFGGKFMTNKKQVLQGIDNFKKLIDLNGYYVDKTLFIKDLIKKVLAAFLFFSALYFKPFP